MKTPTPPKSEELAVTPSTRTVLATSIWRMPIPKFGHLLAHAKTLIRLHGPHTTYPNTTVLARASVPHLRTTSNAPSAQILATSFAAAQDAHGSAQPDGPAKDDLELFTLLWRTAIHVVEQILEDGNLDGEAFGWGVYGLSFGYMPSFRSSSTSSSSSAREECTDRNFDDDLFPNSNLKPFVPPPAVRSPSPSQATFEALKHRLHTALLSLPGVHNAQCEKGRSSVSPAERVGRLVKNRNEVHLCGTLLMQEFREEDWATVRWGFLIAVVERWLGNLELARTG
jgi:hypothetical protein